MNYPRWVKDEAIGRSGSNDNPTRATWFPIRNKGPIPQAYTFV